MTTNFIGHGLFDKTETVEDYLNSSFKDENFNKFLGLTAYATKAGLDKLKVSLKKAKSHFEEIKFFIGIDDHITTKEVFQTLINLEIESFIYHTQTKVIFHPKIYIFEGKRRNRIIIGSSNLTTKGLSNRNVEASVVMDFGVGDIQGFKVLNQIKDYFQSVINLESENVQKVDNQSLEFFVNEGWITSDKDKKKIDNYQEDDLNRDNDFFPEVGINESSSRDISSITRTNYDSNDTERNPLSQNYLDNWPLHFDELKKYKEKIGHTVVPTDYEDGALFDWCRKQRNLNNNGIIPIEHKKQLDSIDFYWRNLVDWNSEIVWDENYELFKEYYLRFKTFRVSRKHFKKIANWIVNTRMEYHKGLLLDSQIKKMNDLDPTWKLASKEINDDIWFEKLMLLVEYKEQNGHCNVPQTEPNIGRWLNDQRTEKKRGKLNSEREDLLESTGVIWDIGEYNFQLMIDRLTKYKQRFGNYDVPLDFEEDKQLGNFVYRLQTRGTTPERTRILEDLDFNWEKKYTKTVKVKSTHITKDWQANVEKVKALHISGIDVNNIPKETAELKDIKSWILSQQQRYRTSEFKEQQIKSLLEAGVILEKVSKQEQRWSHFYELLTFFKQEHGHCKVTMTFDEEFGGWVSTQRMSYKNKTLDQYKIDKLNELDFEWVSDNNRNKKVKNTEGVKLTN